MRLGFKTLQHPHYAQVFPSLVVLVQKVRQFLMFSLLKFGAPMRCFIRAIVHLPSLKFPTSMMASPLVIWMQSNYSKQIYFVLTFCAHHNNTLCLSQYDNNLFFLSCLQIVVRVRVKVRVVVGVSFIVHNM